MGGTTTWKLCTDSAAPPSLLTRKAPLYSPQVVGVGGTTAWKLCTLSANTTLAVVYDIVAQHGGEAEAFC